MNRTLAGLHLNRLLFFLLALTLLVSAGCGKAGFKEQTIYEVGREHVFLVHETDKNGQVVPKGYDHPKQLTADQIDTLLTELRYSEYSFFKWRGDKQVFLDSERKKLSSHLARAFAEAGPDNWIKFAVTAKKRDLLLPTRRITDGFMWFQDNRLNIVLGNFNWEISEQEDPFSGDPRSRFTLGSLRFNEADGIVRPPVDKSDEFLKRPHNNWVLVDTDKLLKAPDPEATEVTEVAAPAGEAVGIKKAEQPATEEKTLEQRLTELKELLDKGLISQEDYEAKKAKILEEL